MLKWALGTMSGTSLDGVDAAMVLTDGERIAEFGESRYRPYSAAEREVLRAALGQWDGPAVEAAARVTEDAHAELLAGFRGADLIGFHGQTLAHDPGGRGTLQAGSGERLARLLGVPVAWDFRTEDVRLGGQGAPLAPFFHFAAARWTQETRPVAFLNLGGVGNLTWLDPRYPGPEAAGALLAFDTGPANAPVNDLMAARLGRVQDDEGALAAMGRVDEGVIDMVLRQDFFARTPPKSLDRNDFHSVLGLVDHLSDADACATLTALIAATVAAGMTHTPEPVERLLVTGGGRHNGTLMRMLADRTALEVRPVEHVGLDGDMLEAQAFAYLAVRVARGLALSSPMTTGVPHPAPGGRISG
ncbi:anhydro-N-acetylmuramic acid kinase [Falsirhodobacter algicola]|uniref:Anhydro-N-acetylmuramic acid kinase n=1 Tax=Falsirhodobacter algicola TaxID=2692330 RepID=A0A8J8MRH2_9RHOB|nr:anhydro-N-acetylmuramic acid kinase [Falsirhodobacter algicola]QUS35390.1 anhydro-N-acetylmuramic acid kinase [Falsirhodobacter algicola]